MSNILSRLNDDAADVLGSVQRSLVQVHSGGSGAGAGSVWHSDGLIVTNAHVAAGGPLRVTLPDGTTVPAQLLARDDNRDLAALSVDVGGLPTITPGASRSLNPGQLVLAVGHPWGVLGAATSGIVIGTGADWPDMPWSRRNWLVVNLHLRPGHSGGPMVDISGRLVGVNTMITGPDVGLAVPVSTVKRFLREAFPAQKAAA
ncbi:MAG: serine protease Do [Chloroflexi bacterium]|nr:MAG: serine protease Do [Chloroflexota bacterium]